MRFRIWLVLWIAGILFPMEFLARVWPSFGRIFNPIFAFDWVHVLMHAFLYTVLAFLLAQWFAPISRQNVLVLVGLGVLVGCLQESLQILSMHARTSWPAEIEDLSVDLAGTLIGIGLARLFIQAKFKGGKKRQVERH